MGDGWAAAVSIRKERASTAAWEPSDTVLASRDVLEDTAALEAALEALLDDDPGPVPH